MSHMSRLFFAFLSRFVPSQYFALLRLSDAKYLVVENIEGNVGLFLLYTKRHWEGRNRTQENWGR